MTTDISREEYDARHQELVNRITALEVKVDALTTMMWRTIATMAISIATSFVAGYMVHFIK